jgi:hypothetical protein
VTCKKIVFIQTVRRYAVIMGTETLTSITDWKRNGCFPNADGQATVETSPARRRVDMYWTLESPYYNQDDAGRLPASGSTASFGQVGSDGGMPVAAQLFDRPNTGGACFPPDATRAVLRFEAAPFCVEGPDQGKFLGGQVLTWENHQDKDMLGTTENVAVVPGPSADFTAALNLWVDKKYRGKLPAPKPSPCPP